VKNHALALLVVSLMCWLIAVGSLKAGEVNTLVRKGQRIGVWGYMCKDTICSDNVCLTLQYSDHQPARAIISIEATWTTDADKPIEVTGPKKRGHISRPTLCEEVESPVVAQMRSADIEQRRTINKAGTTFFRGAFRKLPWVIPG
jgi:hypothetical protein